MRQVEIWPEIEGCTEEDVGWCKAPYSVMLCRYVNLSDRDDSWALWYSRPPKLAN